MTLIKPVPIEPADQIGAVHFLAIGGAGMSGIASAYHELGVPVSGCDQVDSANLRSLSESGITTAVGHDVSHLAQTDTLVISSAIRDSNVELTEAKARGLRVWHRSTALAALMLEKDAISIAGSHGKTTTSAMTAVMLDAAGQEPSYVIGAPLASNRRSAHMGKGSAFVVEADESDGSFLQYPTKIAVITNIEADHLDNWGTPTHYAEGFRKFATGPTVEAVVICNDDQGAANLAEQLRSENVRVVTYGSTPGSDVRLTNLDFQGTTASATLTARVDEVRQYELHLQVPGKHNLQNAAAAFSVGRLLGIDPEALLAGISTFTGTLRRFQLVGAAPVAGGGECRVFDDYAHHPTELRAALLAARRVSPSSRLVACFQPHLFSRTRDFATEFGQALTIADVVVVTDVYPSREDPIPGVTGQMIADAAIAAGAKDVHYVPEKSDVPAALADLVQADDLVMTLGAGDVTLAGPVLVSLLNERHS